MGNISSCAGLPSTESKAQVWAVIKKTNKTKKKKQVSVPALSSVVSIWNPEPLGAAWRTHGRAEEKAQWCCLPPSVEPQLQIGEDIKKKKSLLAKRKAVARFLSQSRGWKQLLLIFLFDKSWWKRRSEPKAQGRWEKERKNPTFLSKRFHFGD